MSVFKTDDLLNNIQNFPDVERKKIKQTHNINCDKYATIYLQCCLVAI